MALRYGKRNGKVPGFFALFAFFAVKINYSPSSSN
jgi:hypothetical protein